MKFIVFWMTAILDVLKVIPGDDVIKKVNNWWLFLTLIESSLVMINQWTYMSIFWRTLQTTLRPIVKREGKRSDVQRKGDSINSSRWIMDVTNISTLRKKLIICINSYQDGLSLFVLLKVLQFLCCNAEEWWMKTERKRLENKRPNEKLPMTNKYSQYIQ